LQETPIEQVSTWIEQWKTVTGELVHDLLLYLPNLIGALLVFALGWAIARLGQAAVVRLARTLNRMLARVFADNRWVRVRLSDGAINVIGSVVFWLLVVFALTAAAKIAEFEFFAQWLDRMLSYLPNLLAGTLIVFVGYLAGKFVRDLVTVTFSMAGTEQSRLLGLIAQSATFLIAIVVGLDQAGIDVGFIITLVGILVGAVAASFALAFALGSRSFVANLIGVYQMQGHLQPGRNIKIGTLEGEVLEVTSTGVVLATDEGRMMVPGRLLNEESVSLLTPDRDQ